jgi:Family of unknown function (DUF6131)
VTLLCCLPLGKRAIIVTPVARSARDEQGVAVITLGIILLIVGFLLHIGILWTIGIILLVVGLILFLLGRAGHAIGGRSHWF